MKKLLLPFCFFLCLSCSFAQTATTTLVTAPCSANGVLVVTVTGITPPINFTYYYGAGYFVSPTNHNHILTTTDTLFGWQGGDIDVYVVDSASTASAYTSYSTGPLHYTFSRTTAVCPTPSTLTATVTGGAGGYTYKWYDNAGSLVSTSNPLSTTVSGYYSLIATDASGCFLDSRYVNDTTAYITNTTPFTYSTTTTVASCTNGTASVTGITGGTSPYYYLWSNGATTATNTGLVMGSYWVNIMDASGCRADSNYVYVTQTPTIAVNTTITPPTCLDTNGAVIAFGAGGVSPYTYVWSNGATTQTVTGLGATSLSVTAKDVNGCIGNGYAYLSPSTPITVTYTTTPSSCTAPTGTATLTLAGGTSPYSVQWFTTPPQTGVTATGLMAGSYSFKVTDNVGCVRTGTVYIPPVAVISSGISITAATCTSATGGMALSPSGGTTPYTYSWNTGSTASAITSVPAGWYTFTITDNIGCTLTRTKEIPIFSPVHISFSTSQASCLFTSDGSITAAASGGTSAYTYHWNTGATSATISGLTAGLYWVSVTDAAGCTAWDTVTLGYNPTTDFCYCTIKGKVYFDVNGNCNQDAGEPGIHNIQIHCSGIGYTYTDVSGNYAFKVPTGSYILSQNILAYYPLSSCQSNSITASVTAASGCTHVVNFADTLNPIHDIHISTWDYSYAIPGHTYTQTSIVSNEGTLTESGILAGYKADGQLYSPTFVPSGIFSGGTGYWYNTSGTYPSLAAGASNQFFMSYGVPTSIPLATNVLFKDSVAYASPMSNWLTDYSPWNNVNYFSTTVIGSYDPNFKEVSPKGYGTNGIITYKDSVLEYMVHFQNTGTWYAENIVVIDTLDSHLDWSTLRPVFQSHPCQVSVSEAGVAKFTFANINLDPQMFNDLRSNGMFTYTIKTRSGLPTGTQFKNRAAIYFDYNKPIYTNTTLNTLGWAASVPNVNTAEKGSSFTLFPNPADNSFNAIINNDADGHYHLRVTDIAGRTMVNKPLFLQKGVQTITVDASLLSSGVYFVTLSGEDKVQTQKLVILK